jgi:hypothetical protein
VKKFSGLTDVENYGAEQAANVYQKTGANLGNSSAENATGDDYLMQVKTKTPGALNVGVLMADTASRRKGSFPNHPFTCSPNVFKELFTCPAKNLAFWP